jgi:formate C-acetyltransferase
MPEVDVERPRHVTLLHDKAKLLGREVKGIGILDKARIYRRILEERTPVVRHRMAWEAGRIKGALREAPRSFAVSDRSPFAGSTTSCYKGVVIYPEFLALTLWPELRDLPRRKSNPYQISDDQIEVLDRDVFPHWLDKTHFSKFAAACIPTSPKSWGCSKRWYSSSRASPTVSPTPFPIFRA